MKIIDLDDDRNCYIGSDGEYERWNIDPDAIMPILGRNHEWKGLLQRYVRIRSVVER